MSSLLSVESTLGDGEVSCASRPHRGSRDLACHHTVTDGFRSRPSVSQSAAANENAEAGAEAAAEEEASTTASADATEEDNASAQAAATAAADATDESSANADTTAAADVDTAAAATAAANAEASSAASAEATADADGGAASAAADGDEANASADGDEANASADGGVASASADAEKAASANSSASTDAGSAANAGSSPPTPDFRGERLGRFEHERLGQRRWRPAADGCRRPPGHGRIRGTAPRRRRSSGVGNPPLPRLGRQALRVTQAQSASGCHERRDVGVPAPAPPAAVPVSFLTRRQRRDRREIFGPVVSCARCRLVHQPPAQKLQPAPGLPRLFRGTGDQGVDRHRLRIGERGDVVHDRPRPTSSHNPGRTFLT
jgi:hypothetical protein